MKKITFLSVFLAHLLMFGCSSTKQKQSPVKLQLLGQVEIPYNESFQGTPIGGLSGLGYSPGTQTYYVISDDRGELAAARFYSFKLVLNEQGELTKGGIRWKSVHVLKAEDGRKYEKGTIDPEGIAVGPNSLIYVSSEGDPGKNIAPFIDAFTKTGTFVKAFPIPNAFWADNKEDRKGFGIRENLAFEGLTISPNGDKLYAATENALFQDGTAADSIHSSPSRMIVYDIGSESIIHQYEYKVAPVFYASKANGGFAVNGLSDVLTLGNKGHLFSLERNYVQGQGNRISLYYISTHGATDIKGLANLKDYDQPVQAVKKQLIANMDDFGILVDNFEGLVFGPRLKDGGRLLLMVSDNNFSSNQKKSIT
ncbi:MAG: esterase-like activity of phytase family protein [Balneolaceae bacterium]|jgi:hypothetical protein